MRVHILAKELNVTAKTIIDKCRAEGIDTVKNHMSTLSAGLHATIREWFSEGSHDTVLETTERINLAEVRIKTRRRRVGEGGIPLDSTGDFTDVAVDDSEEDSEEHDEGLTPYTADEEPVVEEILLPTSQETTVDEVTQTIATTMPTQPVQVVEALPPAVVLAPVATSPQLQPMVTPIVAEIPPPPTSPKPIAAAGPQHVPVPAKLQGPRVVRYEAPDRDVHPIRRPPATGTFAGKRRGPDIPPPGLPSQFPAPGAGTTLDGRGSDKAAVKKKPKVSAKQADGRLAEAGERLAEWRDRDLAERKERLATATGRKIHHRRATPSRPSSKNAPAAPPEKTAIQLQEPVRIKDFCSATGINFIQLFKVLKDEHNLLVNINMTLPTETIELISMHFGVDVEVSPAKTLLDAFEDEVIARERHHLKLRPPVVTMLGHVDHGKTSLLDAIRKTRVVASEDGGITQHIGSYHLMTDHGPVTFLDTPGHEAFTAMRARGAQMTDVVVLVIAADDGVMPQTVEAINHAKAAEVPIVVALNKIDLGDQNKLKIYGQLSEHSLAPSEWGGEVDVIPTSATTGLGVKELVEHLADLSSLLDLQADSTLPAAGTVIEAETKPGVGPVARLLVSEGTLRVGDIVVCGNAFGKVRALVNDRGEKVNEVGPAIPAEVWGLDDVPMAGDKLYQVDNPQRAKEIAAEMKKHRVHSGRMLSTKATSLEHIFKQKDTAGIPELNLVIKADVDGSVTALKTSLAEIRSDEVRLSIRHAGVGAVTDSDILLAATCRGFVVAFRVDAAGGARKLADQHGVEIRPYRVIYDVCDDIRKALEGLLAPEERIESRGMAEIKQIFHISKVGVIAGSMVIQGTLERGHLAKVIRNSVVIRQNCKFSSLRRFKDDVKEVRTGMECGIRLEGFDDLHAGDTIETYEIIKIARKLQ